MDLELMNMVLGNLITNGLRYSGTYAHIDIFIQLDPGSDFLMRVRDNGPGIPPDEPLNLGQPYYRMPHPPIASCYLFLVLLLSKMISTSPSLAK